MSQTKTNLARSIKMSALKKGRNHRYYELRKMTLNNNTSEIKVEEKHCFLNLMHDFSYEENNDEKLCKQSQTLPDSQTKSLKRKIVNQNYRNKIKKEEKDFSLHQTMHEISDKVNCLNHDTTDLDIIKYEIQDELNAMLDDIQHINLPVLRLIGGADERVIRNRVARRIIREQAMNNIGIATRCNIDTFNETAIQPYRLGQPNSNGLPTNHCAHCDALYWDEEKNTNNVYTKCCNAGKTKITNIHTPPELLANLFQLRETEKSKRFFKNSRGFNTSVSFASTKVNDYHFKTPGVPTMRINGQISHVYGPVIPNTNNEPLCMQCFFTEGDIPNNYLESDDDKLLLYDIRRCISEVSPIVRTIRAHMDRVRTLNNETPNFKIKLGNKPSPTNDPRLYVLPEDHQLAIVILDDDTLIDLNLIKKNREIVIESHNAQLKSIPSNMPAYDPMSYAMLFPYGEPGWTLNIPEFDPVNNVNTHKHISTQKYYEHRLHFRDPIQSPNIIRDSILHAGLLSHQYIIDSWVKTEENRLTWIFHNQDKIRADVYQGMADAINRGDTEGATIGRKIILPSSHIGSPRYMHQEYQDAMAVVQKCGKPDLFITMTCNPNWEEIKNNLKYGEVAAQRPDLTGRVFNMKLKNLLKEIVHDQIFGQVIAHLHVVEFQKRGLPHAHILIILGENDKIHTVDQYDNVVCAEIPNQVTQPRLYAIVTRNMVHGPCGKTTKCPCELSSQTPGVCRFNYPFAYKEHTEDTEDSYPLYRRRQQHERHFMVRENNITNEWISPYNPYLSLRYECHINVEICASISAVKYLYKYVYKGPDMTMVRLEEEGDAVIVNEITNFINARYVTANESIWRLFSFVLSNMSPCVIRLPVHLENMQNISYNEGNLLHALENAKDTPLMGYFKKVTSDYDAAIQDQMPRARDLTYNNFCDAYTWVKSTGTWKRRVKKGYQVGRMYSVFPSAGDKYYLRILLCQVKGAKSFRDLRSYENVVYDTNRAACLARGLLQDDEEWRLCIRDAAVFRMPSQLRSLFTYILRENSPLNPAALFEEFKKDLSEDFCHQRDPITHRFDDSDFNECLWTLDSILKMLPASNGGNEFYGLPAPNPTIPRRTRNINLATPLAQEINRCNQFDSLQEILNNGMENFNRDQRNCFDIIISSIEPNYMSKKIFFIDAIGGTGKTYLLNILLAYFRSREILCVATASSGIAATLLQGGSTAHSQFKIPIPLMPESTCSISRQSDMGKFLILAKVIVWDEAFMSHKNNILVVDKLLKDLTGNKEELFGGKIVILSGDPRQTLPIIKHGSKAQVIYSCIKFCPMIWSNCTKLTLTINERIRRNGNGLREQEFAAFILDVGNNSHTLPRIISDDNTKHIIQIPSNICPINLNLNTLIDEIYPQLNLGIIPVESAILTPKNKEVDHINEKALDIFTGEILQLLSADTVFNNENLPDPLYPIEFINSININGIPLHNLKVKLGAPLMLLRNLDITKGLCNGTRMTLISVTNNVLRVRLINGSHSGNEAFIPRIELSPADNALPFKLKRRQFPVRLCFGMTINKAQGQSMQNLGVYLPNPVFGHGQLYVAISRAGLPDKTKVLITQVNGIQGEFDNYIGTFTENVVYSEVLVNN